MTTLPVRLALLALAAFVILIPFTTYAQQSEQSNIQKNAEFPHWSFTKEMIFPTDRSLLRPEDGVILPDGRLIVADQAHGLRLIHNDGVHRPFGRFAAAGYIHPPLRLRAEPMVLPWSLTARISSSRIYTMAAYIVSTLTVRRQNFYTSMLSE